MPGTAVSEREADDPLPVRSFMPPLTRSREREDRLGVEIRMAVAVRGFVCFCAGGFAAGVPTAKQSPASFAVRWSVGLTAAPGDSFGMAPEKAPRRL